MKFAQIVCVDDTGLTSEGLDELRKLSSKEPRCFSDSPASRQELVARIGDADAVLVSWNTAIPAPALRAAEHLRYVGMCCSLYDAASANVDIEAADDLGIAVRGVRDYGDEGVVEFILAQLIFLMKGLASHQWSAEAEELAGKTLGIIGLGKTGQMVARACRCLGMDVWYYSRTRKTALEHDGLRYAPLDELLARVDVVSTHLPRNTRLLDASAFDRMKPGAVLVNTSLGPTFDVTAFRAWISRGRSFAIFDADGAGDYSLALARYENVILSDKVAGWTAEARQRLTAKVLDNLRGFLAST